MMMTLGGFRLETPVKYIQNEGIYHITNWILLLALLICSFFLTWFTWWVGPIIVLLLYRIISIISRNIGVIKYKKKLKDLYESAFISEEEKRFIKGEMQKTNSEILNSFRDRVNTKSYRF